jgi:hypothetical protein
LRSYFDSLLTAPGDVCRPLSDETLERLAEDYRVKIGSESSQNRRRQRSTSSSDGTTLFGAAVPGLSGAPALPAEFETPWDDFDQDEAPFSTILRAEGEEEEEEGAVGADESTAAEPTPGTGLVGFWKTLSKFDVSTTSAPGQILVPIRFLDFFGEMNIQRDETATGGVKQSDVYLPVEFRDTVAGNIVRANDARAILYEPAEDHPRPNKELRFTFRDRSILKRLQQGDVLVFTRMGSTVTIERRPEGSMGSKKFDQL